MADKTYVGNIGTVIEVDMGRDISDASTTNFLVTKGQGSTDTWTATIYEENYLRYTIEDGDLDEAGTYYIQPYLVFTDWTGYGKTVSFTVNELWR